ncbi:hypothetical protein EC973_009635 [Apophysomyces ossiformis]|uniref:UDP-glycosyltransferases domain-containing protein n=1 Tax=Apophysomyces ossiformis TaxID=679940 RepID=A0A8H7BQT2_9FUNG|nr:hypothetical protein EC973_009635 [Apophysomyces ossiformis]
MVQDRPAMTIHMSATLGGISHIGWVLEIGKVLTYRGHNVSFITTDTNLPHVKKYPEINPINIGPEISSIKFRDLFDIENPFSVSVRQAYIKLIRDTMARDYEAYKGHFLSSKPSLVFCDHMALACMDAAHMLNIPIVVTMTMSISEASLCSDTRAPFIRPFFSVDGATTLNKSLWDRFFERYFTLPRFILRHQPVLRALNKKRQELGIEPWEPLGRHAGTVKFINSFWGLDSPRPVGPFVEYVGPIISGRYDALTTDLASFLNTHKAIAYVAFGQMYAPNPRELVTLLTGLLEAYESHYLDGFVWSLSGKTVTDIPPTIKTSRTRYNTTSLLMGYQRDIRFESWTPQFAILNHTSCRLFVSHGGASSIHESLYNGVPLLLHPFTSDQPINANQMAKAGVGLVIDRRNISPQEIAQKIRTIVLDEGGTYADNIKAMQAVAEIYSRRLYYAADVVEEILYSRHGNESMWHRKEDTRHMSWWKATNWDVDALALTLLIGGSVAVYRSLLGMQVYVSKKLLVRKMKQKIA